LNHSIRKIESILVIILLTILILPSITFSVTSETQNETKNLYLLRGEHYLELKATENTGSFHVKYVFPPDYGYQAPIVLELLEETTAHVVSYSIEAHGVEPNRVVNFTIGSMQKDEHQMLHFTIWVLVEHHDFSDVPEDTPLPRFPHTNPPETREWLSPSEMVQVHRPRIKYYANRLEGRNGNILNYAQNVASFIKNHRYGLFLIQLWTGMFFKQDALTTLMINGENVGRSHLACALFRTKNIPARVVLAHNDQGFWTQMHYMVEYYVSDYGWVLLDSTKGETPYLTHRQIINRICSIEDENDTKEDYILPFMRGEERWIWIDTEHVQPYYVDCDEASKSQMFTETIVSVKLFAADYAFFRTQNVFTQYQKYLGDTLSVTNQQHLDNAIDFQLQACYALVETDDINEYVYYIEKAFDEYKKIQ
jgi:transglutaminase-like putative cysteine protease